MAGEMTVVRERSGCHKRLQWTVMGPNSRRTEALKEINPPLEPFAPCGIAGRKSGEEAPDPRWRGVRNQWAS